ncbi:ArsR/SmtB family transcription factor [Trueperella bialowiezensis]|uniref:ArsR/SmtB family transcription factor n=1 Tax=Trueperella bialowiezensis TaxID=312285 RepID=UPI000F83E509|nr:metalloregulator ArsR/SmtB family transcription factor [Trueperella bialowiezensis]
MNENGHETVGDGHVHPVVELFKALAHPIRADIVHRLTESPASVGELVDHVEGASQPLVSHHLRILRDAHLVQATRIGRNNEYSLVDDHVAAIFLAAWNHTEEHDNDCNH